MTRRDFIVIAVWFVFVVLILSLGVKSVYCHIPTWESKYPGDPNPFGVVGHFCPNTAADPCFTSKTCGIDLKQYEGGHGHINDDGTWGYWSKGSSNIWDDGDALDCSPKPPKKRPKQPPKKPPKQTPVKPTDNQPRVENQLSSTDTEDIVDGQIEEEIIESDPHWSDGMTTYWDYGQFYIGPNLISFPYMKPELRTIADFFSYYYSLNWASISVLIDGEWVDHDGSDSEDSERAGKVPIEPYLGVIANMAYPLWLGCASCARVIGDEIEVELVAGLNVVGITSLPGAYTKPSDFLNIDGIDEVQVSVWDDDERTNVIVTINDAGDTGDDNLYLGQAVVLVASKPVVLDMSEAAQSAPMAQRPGTLTLTWGSLKQTR